MTLIPLFGFMIHNAAENKTFKPWKPITQIHVIRTRLIKRVSKHSPRWFLGKNVGRKRGSLYQWHPTLSFSYSFYRIDKSPKDHALYDIHTNKVMQSKVGLLEPLLSHNAFSLYVFSFYKRSGGRKRRNEWLNLKLGLLKTLENEMYL